jgi:hypothetical protein
VAIVSALLLIVVLSVSAAAALGMVGSERRVVDDQEAAAEAHALARSGYDQFVSNPTAFLPAFSATTFVGPDSTLIAFNDGYAWVMAMRVRPSVAGSKPLFLIRSRGVRTINRPVSTPVAERIFSQYAQWQDLDMTVLAAWTALSGLLKEGGSGIISGTDNCGSAAAIAGVAVPNVPGYTQNGGSPVPTGSPPVQDLGTQASANSAVQIDWATVLNTMSLSADIVVPGSTWPSFANTSYWPVVYVDQVADFALPSSGRGILIVRNNLTINGSTKWDGIVLVGGALTSNGNNTVNGAVVTGLNVLLGESAAASDLGNGNKAFRYDACNVESAMRRFNGLVPWQNSAADNWASY